MSSDDVMNVVAERSSAAIKRAILLRKAEGYLRRIQATGDARAIRIWEHAFARGMEGNLTYLFALMTAKTIPVTFDEFISSKEFFSGQMDIWPALVDKLKVTNADVLAGEPAVHESYLGGATGTGKTARAHATTAYQLYCLTCFKHPQQIWGLSAVTPLVFLMQSVSTTITNRVIYKPFRQMFTDMQYSKKWVAWNKLKESEFELDGNIQIVPALASINSMVGSAIIGGIFDEINFMSVIENSKQVPGMNGLGGLYDQAQIIHSNVTRRRKGRFPKHAPSFGVLNFISSTRYKGDFLDRRMDEALANEEEHVQICREKQYEVKPEYIAATERFRFLVGTDTYPGRVLRDHERAGEHYPENGVVELIPMAYRQDFERNPEEASRDVIGVASLSITPFFSQRHKVLQAILRGEERGVKNWVLKDDVDLLDDGMAQWDEDVLAELPASVKRRDWFVHFDMSRNHDRLGACAVSIADYVDVVKGKGDDIYTERLPVYEVGFSVSIQPSPTVPINIPELRQWLMLLVNYFGINIVKVTFDGFDSAESIRFFQTMGIRSSLVSMDRTIEPSTFLRDAIYSDRLAMTDHELLRLEIIQLEHLVKKGKVDHPPKGSKDVLDALTGALFSAGHDRMQRTQTGPRTPDGQRPTPAARPRPKRPSRSAMNRHQEDIAPKKTESELDYS